MGEVIPFPIRRGTSAPRAAVEFRFDLADPFTYLVAERVEWTFAALEWIPVTSLRAADAEVAERARERARALRLPLVWPERWPAAVPGAMRLAVHAVRAGRGAPFVLAASRLAFAGGYDLEDPGVLAEAAAAAGLLPEVAARAAGDPGLDPRHTARAEHLPALRVAGTLHTGEACLDLALLAASRVSEL
jgi:2-hydroxychromene-2-carboxylate isomerase